MEEQLKQTLVNLETEHHKLMVLSSGNRKFQNESYDLRDAITKAIYGIKVVLKIMASNV